MFGRAQTAAAVVRSRRDRTRHAVADVLCLFRVGARTVLVCIVARGSCGFDVRYSEQASFGV
jgi:RNase P/RNase MRP subunit POP5